MFTKILSLPLLFIMYSLAAYSGPSCLGYYSSTKLLSLNQSQEKVVTLSSNRKMKIVFQKGHKFDSKKELTVVLHGLGKSSANFEDLKQEAARRGDSVLLLDLHGFGETAKLNNNYFGKNSIPYEMNRDDVLEILQSFDPNVRIKLVGHSYGGGITLSILEKIAHDKIKINITDAALLSTFAKSMDKYYQDAAFSGQNMQVALDYMNPILKMAGFPKHLIESMDHWNNYFLFSSNAISQQFRDSMYAWNPFLDPVRNTASSLPNFMANMMLAPFHIVANSELKDIKKWQEKPQELAQLLLNNVGAINGIQNLNFLDYSKKLNFPKHIKLKFVHAQNDSVVPNTMTQELQKRFIDAGYNIKAVSLLDENHYYLYASDIANNYDLIFN